MAGYHFFSQLPIDVVASIFDQITAQRDLAQCALANRTFNRCATPILYKSLTFRTARRIGINSEKILPQDVLVQKPVYARYVRHVRQCGSLGFVESALVEGGQQALRLCTNLRSFTWHYAGKDPSDNELADQFDILRDLPLKHIEIHTSGLNQDVWNKMTQLKGLESIALWCLHAQMPPFLSWSLLLRESLTSLELNVNQQSDTYLSFLSGCTKLKHLRLKGVPTNLVSEILQVLPNLESLDTDYFPSRQTTHDSTPITTLKLLTVRASLIPIPDHSTPLWSWIFQLAEKSPLESLIIHSGTQCALPQGCLTRLAKEHGRTLKNLNVQPVEMTESDLARMCTVLPSLEGLTCSVSCTMDDVEIAISAARNLQHLQLFCSEKGGLGNKGIGSERARYWMLRNKSRIRRIKVNMLVYTGQWCLNKSRGRQEASLRFDVKCDTLPWLIDAIV